MTTTAILLVDAGNTRAKFGVSYAQEHITPLGAVAWRLDTTPQTITEDPTQAWINHVHAMLTAAQLQPASIMQIAMVGVAGAKHHRWLELAIMQWFKSAHQTPALQWYHSQAHVQLHAQRRALSLHNQYEQPDRMGADRWMGAIGATSQVFNTVQVGEHCVIASFGTATTIDTLYRHSPDVWHLLGGMILPGVELMRSSLHQGTAQLPSTSGHAQSLPRHTQAAISTGVLAAQIGALRVAASQVSPVSHLLLTGGHATDIATNIERLDTPLAQQHRLVVIQDLVLHGLNQLAWASLGQQLP